MKLARLFSILCALSALAATARGQTIVTNNADSGAGSLRQAVLDAPAGSTITFSDPVRGAVTLTTGQIVIDKNLTIAGPGADLLTVRNGASSRIFQVNSGVTATISGLTVAEGLAGGISNEGTVTVADCVVRDNRGGGIFNRNVLAVTNSNILHNTASTGGGIYNVSGVVTVINSSITGNIATGDSLLTNGGNLPIWGSAISSGNGNVTITSSTIAGNEDRGFANNQCVNYPGGVCPPYLGCAILVLTFQQSGPDVPRSELTLINSTVTDNIQKAAVSTGYIPVTARNSIINGLTNYGLGSSADLTSQGYNLIVSTVAMMIQGDTTGNILNADPRLGPLGYYGGPTLTRAPLTGSPAINTGNTADSPAADQRGAARVGAADIGAFELNNSTNGGNFVFQLPDAFTEISYSYLLVEDTSVNNTAAFTYSLTGGTLPTGLSLSTSQFRRVLVTGRTAQTGVFAFSVTATNATRSFVTDYRLRVLSSGAPPFGGCRTNAVVTNSSDSGEGTLRQAVTDACADGIITFGGEAARGWITLTSGPLEITKNLTIAGPGAEALTIRNGAGNGPQNRVMHVNFGNATVLVSGLTISDGYAGGGGGISNGGNLTLRNTIITNNQSDGPGGGISSGGTLTLVNSLVSGNGYTTLAYQHAGARGGGINFAGTSLTVTDSTVSGNRAVEGGGIYVDFGASVSMTNSTVRDNGAAQGSDGGGGLFLADGTATLTNCTVSQNTGGGTGNAVGGGISVGDSSILTLINSTIANNSIGVQQPFTFGGGIAISGAGTVNARNSIIAGNITGNATPAQVAGTLTSQGYNLISSRQGMTITGVTTGNIVPAGSAVIDAKLGPLANNGGPTMTHALLTGSPAINVGNTATSPATDQRGFGRNGTADMGAFELGGAAPAVVAVSAASRKTHGSAGTFDLNLPLAGGVAVESRSGGASGSHTVVVNFANTLTNVGSAVVTSGAGSVSSSQIGSDTHQYVINLAGVGNAQRLTVALNNVTDSFGYQSSSVPVTMGVLLGDTNGNGSVSASDIGETKASSGQPVSAANFFIDVNANGAINASDIGAVKAQSGTQLP